MTEFKKIKVVPKTKRAKKFHETIFLPIMKKILTEIKRTQLSILIWGPSKSNELMYKKRVDILNELRKKDHDAFFSEELTKESEGNKSISHKAQEFIQASAAELIIILRCSYGSVAETHDFADYKKIASKMLIFVDEETKQSYSNQGAIRELGELYRRIEVFRYPDDIVACNLLKKIKSTIIALQRVKYCALKNAEEWEINL